jgi:outer membrane lipoprotein-sorting protein
LTEEEKKDLGAAEEPWFHLTPKPQKRASLGTVSALIIRVDRNHLISEIWVLDALGSKTHWIFKNIRLNQTIADAIFTFKIPKGVQVLDY